MSALDGDGVRRPAVRSVRMINAIEVVVVEGRGVEGDPSREVVYIFGERGNLRARMDPWLDAEHGVDEGIIGYLRNQADFGFDEPDRGEARQKELRPPF